MNKEFILSIDNGTQSVRALIFDLHGRLLYKKTRSFEALPFAPAGLG